MKRWQIQVWYPATAKPEHVYVMSWRFATLDAAAHRGAAIQAYSLEPGAVVSIAEVRP